MRKKLKKKSDRKWTPILRFGETIFAHQIRNKSKRPKSDMTANSRTKPNKGLKNI